MKEPGSSAAAHVNGSAHRKVDVQDADAGPSRRFGSDVEVNGGFDGAAHGRSLHQPGSGNRMLRQNHPLMMTLRRLNEGKFTQIKCEMFNHWRKVGI